MALRVSVVGATGSIAESVEKVVTPRGGVELVGLACDSRIDRLERYIRQFNPEAVGVRDEDKARELRGRIRDRRTKVFDGPEGVLDATVRPKVDLVVIASVGLDAFNATLEAVTLGRNIAPASKEPFVFGSEVINPIIKMNNVQVRPVDSEISAIWRIGLVHNNGRANSNGGNCVVGIDTSEFKNVWLGCSGGPLYGMTWGQMKDVTAEQVLKHPTWAMGRLVTTNSATLFNKLQERFETRAMYNVPLERIGATIDRTSNLHAAVEFKDGTILTNVSRPSMEDPVRFAIYGDGDRSHIKQVNSIDVVKPDDENFKLLRVGEEAGRKGGTTLAAMVAANDAAVEHFHNRTIGFREMVELVEEVVERHRAMPATKDSIVAAYNEGTWMVWDMVMSRHGSGVEDAYAAARRA
jgi:1-deoxy-D-xylulose-5-phosphate reductoisomerase